MEELKLRLGARIRVLRQYHNLSQPEFGSRVGHSSSSVSEAERGAAAMTVSQFIAYAENLGVTVETLLRGLIKPPKVRVPDEHVATLFKDADKNALAPRGDRLPPHLRRATWGYPSETREDSTVHCEAPT